MTKIPKEWQKNVEYINGLLLIKSAQTHSAESTEALARRIFPGLDDLTYAQVAAQTDQLFEGSFAYVQDRQEAEDLGEEVKSAFPVIYDSVAELLIERAKNILSNRSS